MNLTLHCSATLQIVQLQPQTVLRFNGDETTGLHLGIRVSHFKPESQNKRSQYAAHLTPRETLADAAARAVKESDQGVSTPGTTGSREWALDPPLWPVLVGICAP